MNYIKSQLMGVDLLFLYAFKACSGALGVVNAHRPWNTTIPNFIT